MHIVPEILNDIHQFLRILMSESNKHQQDLESMREDLGSLKFGFALLQNSNAELSNDVSWQGQQLKQIQKTLDSQGDDIDKLQSQVDNSAEHLDFLESVAHPCGGSALDWTKVVDLDMGRPSDECPMGWMEGSVSKRTCRRATSTANSCDMVTFSVRQKYSKICGRIVAYKYGATDAFLNFELGTHTTLGSPYVDGVVLYHGSGPSHIWTFAAGITERRLAAQPPRQRCNCDLDPGDRITLPSFVGDHYFCESQNDFFSGPLRFRLYYEDILWDGEECLDWNNCCEFNRPPYFIRDLGMTTTEDIVASICLRRASSQSDIAVEVVELYVQ